MDSGKSDCTKGRIPTLKIIGTELGDFVKPKSFIPDKPNILNIFPIEDDAEYLAKAALNCDLSNVLKLRFDPINTCNSACLFCPSNMRQKSKQISPSILGKIIKAVSKTCQRIQFGCGFEPLMVKNLSEYGNIIQQSLKNDFLHKPIISITTNGILLDKRNIDIFINFISWLHISMASHNKERFTRIERNNYFDRVVSNIKYIRNKYKHLNIHIEMIVNKINIEDATEFISWAFNELKVNSFNLRRVDINMPHHKNSFLAETLSKNYSIDISNEEWKGLINNVLKLWPDSELSNVSLGKNNQTQTIELTNYFNKNYSSLRKNSNE